MTIVKVVDFRINIFNFIFLKDSFIHKKMYADSRLNQCFLKNGNARI